jgi:hypothetical protein
MSKYKILNAKFTHSAQRTREALTEEITKMTSD